VIIVWMMIRVLFIWLSEDVSAEVSAADAARKTTARLSTRNPARESTQKFPRRHH
jgi:hypothetical protein